MSLENNYTLFNYCVGVLRRQPDNPLAHIAPATPVPGKMFAYKHYPQTNVFRKMDTSRPIGAEARALDVVVEDKSGILESHAVKVRIYDAELELMAGQNEDAQSQLTFGKMSSMLGTWRTSYIADGFEKLRDKVAPTATADWSGVDSRIISNLRDIITDFMNTGGIIPNRILMGKEAFDILSKSPEVLDRLSFAPTKTLTPEFLMEMIGLTALGVSDMKFIISNVPVGINNPGPGVPFVGKDVVGKEMWLSYVDDAGLINGDLSGARTFSRAGADMIDNMRSYRDDTLACTVYEAAADRLFEVTCPYAIKRFNIA